jgi:iron complex transport system ATP-binding protein
MMDIQAHALHLRLDGRPVLEGISAHLSTGWTAVVGPNGAGKSSLLRLLAGLWSPEQGQVLLGGRALTQWPVSERARHLAWLAQAQDPSGELTVFDTVMLGRLPHFGLFGSPTSTDRAAVEAALQATESGAWRDRLTLHLSGGERQRVMLARLLATEAPVFLLDEPTTHLDPPHQVALARLLRRLSATHTVVSVLHDLPLALAADRVLLLHEGRLVMDAPALAPALHRAIEQVFDQALEIHLHEGRALVEPRL